MSPRARGPRGSSTELARADLPALSAFLTGYLHQDMFEEHDSPAAALRAFLEAATPDERARLLADWRAFQERTASWPWAAVRRNLATLGSAWVPTTRSALDALFADLSPT